MPNSYVEYTGNGVTTTYSVPFPYLDQDHVEVYLDEVSTSAFTWASSSSITFNAAPGNGVAILIKRNTPYTELVNFTTRTRLRSSSLNTFSKQLRYLVEETVEWHDAIATLHDEAETAATAAAASAAAAATSETAAELAETNAETAETNAETAETNAETAQAAAASSASSASTSATTATTKATEAAASATAAAASATAAAASATAAATAETNAETAETNAETAQAAAEAAQAAAEAAADSIQGIPAGGTDGQVLAKQSGTDYDVAWETVAGSGDVVGPASVTADNPAVFDGTTGKLIKQITYAAFKTALALVKGDVGLGNVDNTSDATKFTDTALTGTPTAPTAVDGTDTTQIATTAFVQNAIDLIKNGVSSAFDTLAEIATELALKATSASPTFTGTVTVPNDSFTYAKLQNVSATDKVLGRSSSGAGDIEEIACTAAGRALIDDADASAQRTTLSAAARSQTDFISLTVKTVANETIRILTKAPFAFTIDSITSDCASGTCSAKGQIDGVDLGGGANSVSTTESEVTHSSANSVSVGNDVDIVVSSNSSCTMMNLTIKITRTLA